MWHPLIAKIQLTGTGIGQLRTIETIDGKQIIERLEAIDDSQRLYRYTMISGIPAADYTGTLDVKPKGTGSSVEWRVQYLADGQPDFIVKTIVSTLAENRPRKPQTTLRCPEMIEAPQLEMDFPLATAGDIAVNQSAERAPTILEPVLASAATAGDRRVHRRTRATDGAVSRRPGCARPPG